MSSNSITFDVEKKVLADQLVVQDSFSDEFVCKICLVHVVGCGPKLTKCGHLFCGDCLDQWSTSNRSNQSWAQRAKSAGTVPCPMCREPLKKNDIYPVNGNESGKSADLWSMIQSLQVRCLGGHGADCSGKCCWTGTYAEYSEHLEGDIMLEPPESGADSSVCSSPRPSIGDIAELSTDESAPDEEGYVKNIGSSVEVKPEEQLEESSAPTGAVKEDLNSLLQALVQLQMNETETTVGYVEDVDSNVEAKQEPQEQLEQSPTHAGAVKEDLNSLLQALVELKMNETETTSRPQPPPGFEDFEPIPHQAEMTVAVDKPQQSQQPALKNKKKKVAKAAKTAKADHVQDSKTSMQAQSLAFHEAMVSQQAIYYQRTMQWQAMRVAQMQAYAGQVARYQQMAAAAHAAQMPRVSSQF